MLRATVGDNFSAGPFTLEIDGDPAVLGDDDRLIITFSDFEALFAVIGRARGALHLGMYVTPWAYIHWRAEPHKGRWVLSTTDRVEIARLKRFYHITP